MKSLQMCLLSVFAFLLLIAMTFPLGCDNDSNGSYDEDSVKSDDDDDDFDSDSGVLFASSQFIFDDDIYLTFNKYDINLILSSHLADNSSGQWTIENLYKKGWDKYPYDGVHSVAIDSNGIPHLSMQIKNRLNYVAKKEGLWEFINLDVSVGKKASIILDKQENVHIGIPAGYHLYYATNSSGEWKVTSLPQRDLTTSFNNVPLAVDSDNHIHTCIAANDGIFHLEKVENKWQMTKIHSNGTVPQIAIDANDQIHICFDGEGGNYAQIGYATYKNDTWELDFIDIDPELDLLYDLAMTLDSQGNAYILYTCYFYGSPLYLANNSSGEWEIEIVDPTRGSAGHSLVVDSNNTVHIFYYGYYDLIYATNASGQWELEEFESLI